VVDIENGSAWAGYGTKIYNYSTSGSLVRTVTTASEIQALAFDTEGDRLIAALEGSIISVSDSTGSVSTIATLTGLGEPVGLTVDSYTRDIWVLTNTHLAGYYASGTSIGSTSVSGGTRVAGDGLGGLWVAKTANLVRYTPNANEVVENIQPFGSSGTILDMAADAFTGEVWVSDGMSVQRYDNDAVLQEEYVRAVLKLALTSDNAYLASLVDKRGTGASMRVVNSVWRIYSIFAGSGAEAADMRADDELQSINGINVPATNASLQDHATFLAAAAYIPGVLSRIEIPPPATLSGRLDPGSEEETAVTIYGLDRPEPGSAAWALNIVAGGSPQRAKTLSVGPPGTFRVTGLQPGEYRIYASGSANAGVVEFRANPGRESEVVVPMGAVGGISGEVREGGTANRIGEAMIYLRSPERDSSIGIAVTDGRFANPHLLPGKYFIRVAIHGDEEPVTILPGQTTTMILRNPGHPTSLKK